MECLICREDIEKVLRYHCGYHPEFCESCIRRIMGKDNWKCPYCFRSVNRLSFIFFNRLDIKYWPVFNYSLFFYQIKINIITLIMFYIISETYIRDMYINKFFWYILLFSKDLTKK